MSRKRKPSNKQSKKWDKKTNKQTAAPVLPVGTRCRSMCLSPGCKASDRTAYITSLLHEDKTLLAWKTCTNLIVLTGVICRCLVIEYIYLRSLKCWTTQTEVPSVTIKHYNTPNSVFIHLLLEMIKDVFTYLCICFLLITFSVMKCINTSNEPKCFDCRCLLHNKAAASFSESI